MLTEGAQKRYNASTKRVQHIEIASSLESRRALYPEIEPYRTGMLPVGDGRELYYEESGNPQGKPAVYLHGGPGGGCAPFMRRFFDPQKYRIITFDQRGCGRSVPSVTAPDANLEDITTWSLVADMEILRKSLGIERWLVAGGSWGSTLALAYAQTHTERVTELVLRGIFTLRDQEIQWFYQYGASEVFPEQWEEFLKPVAVEKRGDLLTAYHELLTSTDPEVYVPASVAWTAWETGAVRLFIDEEGVSEVARNTDMAIAFARIENHFFVNKGWMSEEQLIRGAGKLKEIPTVIVQGRYDMCTPIRTAWELARAMPHAQFCIIPDAGHSATEAGIVDALVRASDAFARAH